VTSQRKHRKSEITPAAPAGDQASGIKERKAAKGIWRSGMAKSKKKAAAK